MIQRTLTPRQPSSILLSMRSCLCVLMLLSGCALRATLPSGEPLRPLQLVHGGGAADVDALAVDFYGGSWTLADMKTRVDAALARHPSSGTAHELAAYLAVLDGDSESSWWHFAQAAADLDAPAEAYLEMLRADLGRRERALTEQLLGELAARHPRAEVRATASFILAQLEGYDGHLDAAVRRVARLGFVERWSFIGPFDNDQGKGFLTVYPPERAEQAVDLARELPGRLVPVRWRAVERTTPFGQVPLSDYVHPGDESVAYLATWVHSDRARPVVLRLTAADPVRVWCNDELVASEELLAGAELDNVRISFTLQAGWNQLVVKSANKGGSWSLGARFTDGNGEPLAGLGFSATPEAHASGAGESHVRYLPEALDTITPASRRHFLVGRALGRAGRSRDALDEQSALLGDAPRNLLARWAAALGYAEHDEQGKAIDLLDHAVEDTGGKVATFLIRRAHYYSGKRLYEKAQRDLQAAIALGPSKTVAEQQLAELYRLRGWSIDRCLVAERMRARQPDYAIRHSQVASCLLSRGLDDAAARELDAAHQLAPGDSWVLDERARLAIRRGQWRLARTRLEEELRHHPTSAELRIELGDVARQSEDRARAATMYREALRILPGWPVPYERLGNLAYEAGDQKEALAQWQLALARNPNDAQLAQHVEQLHPTELGLLQKYMPSDADVDRAISAKIQIKDGAQTVLRLDDEVTEINADGGARRVVTQVIEVANDTGRDANTHQTLPARGALKILQAFVLTKRGERQEASSIRGGDLRFRNLEVGSKIVLQYLYYDQSQHFLPNHFAASWFFSSPNTQHEDSRWTILMPKKRTLHVAVHGAIVERSFDDGDERVRVFRAQGVAPVVAEPMAPPASDVLRYVQVSTVDGWDEYVRWERALLSDAFHDDAQLAELAARLTKGQPSARDKLDQLYHYVTQDIRYQQDYETTIAGVRPHPPSVVLERGYGDCKDKAVLLIQLARLAGLKLRFALLRTTTMGRLEREVPDQSFNHAIAYVPAQPGIEQPFFLDPTSTDLDMGSLRPDDQGATSLVLDPTSGAWSFLEIPYSASTGQLEAHHIHVAVKSPTEAAATDDLTVRGGASMLIRHVVHNRSVAQKLFEKLVTTLFSDGTLTASSWVNDEDIWKPVSLHLSADVSSAIQSQDDRWRFTPPGAFPLADAATLASRELPLWFGPPESRTFDVDIELPAGYQSLHVPADVDESHACFGFHRRARQSGQKVTVHVDYERRCSTLAVADYPLFRAAVKRVVQRFQDEVVFGVTPPQRRGTP